MKSKKDITATRLSEEMIAELRNKRKSSFSSGAQSEKRYKNDDQWQGKGKQGKKYNKKYNNNNEKKSDYSNKKKGNQDKEGRDDHFRGKKSKSRSGKRF